jgi:hypothetical protein
VGFVDKNSQNESKRMLDLPILVLKKKLPTLMRSIGAEGVIMIKVCQKELSYSRPMSRI